MKIIGHIDADCFYVSCERIRDPKLIGKPVGVLGNQGACVIARSYEMKPFGVKVGMPVWEAKKLCPDGIYIKRDFQWYGVLSMTIQEILQDYSDTVEYYSIDESFVDFGEYLEDWEATAMSIQKSFLRKTGLSVSVGISLSRTLAKTASDSNKPLGITVIDRGDLNLFLRSTDIGDVPGIGCQLKKRLDAVGVVSAWDFVNCPVELIKKLLHKPGEQLWYELQGKSIWGVQNVLPDRKVLSRGGSIWGHHKDRDYVWGFLVRNLERFAETLWRRGYLVDNLGISLRTSDGHAFCDSYKFNRNTDSYFDLLKILKGLFSSTFKKGFSYREVHVFSKNLNTVYGSQMNLFDNGAIKERRIVKIKNKVNERFGSFTLRSGATAFCPEVFRDRTSDYEICDLDGKVCF